MQQPKKQDQREIMRELQRQRETEDHRDPDWMRDFYQRDDSNERIRRQLGFGLLAPFVG